MVLSGLLRILNGHKAVTVSFPIGKSGITLQLVQETERRLYGEGRHTFLYQPRPGDDIERITEILNEAGVIVLLALDPQISIPESLKTKERYYSGWEKELVISPNEIAGYISHITL